MQVKGILRYLVDQIRRNSFVRKASSVDPLQTVVFRYVTLSRTTKPCDLAFEIRVLPAWRFRGAEFGEPAQQ